MIVMSSPLSFQLSQYLQQHAKQPVNWMTWSRETFQKAESEDKPVLVSIGYTACHWCNEMSRSCFDDKYIASLMNRHFISILVDREERPDLDHIYMEAVRMFNQSAGWPLNAFCLPDGRPFWGGTFFPKEDLGNGLAPWPQVLMRIAEHYRKAKNELIENAKNVVANLSHANNADCSSDKNWDNKLLGLAGNKLCEIHDDQNGGFTPAPKFPSPMKIDFLITLRESNFLRNHPKNLKKTERCIEKTLNSLSSGGIYDHVGGGFFRYCTDAKWTQPHYEKMLSDNALLISTLSRAFRYNPKEKFRQVTNDTIAWLNQEMGTPKTGYASSMSSESNGVEGDYYEWSEQELREKLGNDHGKSFYDILPSIPHRENGKLPQLVESESFTEKQQLEWISLLKKERKRKTQPLRDDKRLIAHNSLLISGFVQAAVAFNNVSLLSDAIELEKWITKTFLKSDSSVRSYVYPNFSTDSVGNLDDYCFWIKAILDISKITDLLDKETSGNYVEKALQLTEQTILKFKDSKMPGFFFTDEKIGYPLPCRKKIWYDNALPAGNSILMEVFSHFYHLTSDEKWKNEFEQGLSGYSSLAQKLPDGIGYALSAICESAVGIFTVEIPKSEKISDFKSISQSPPRGIHYRSSIEGSSKFQIKSDKGETICSKESLSAISEFLKQ